MRFASWCGNRLAAAGIIGICSVGWIAPAAAYRPFDGTDAAVAELDQVEIEFQPTGLLHADTRSFLAGPKTVINYGFADRWELVLQGEAQAPREGPTDVPNGVFLKYVLQPGVLQDKSGPSIATEFGPLLPEARTPGLGLSWDGIVSQRWDWGTAHFNVEADLTPDHHGEAFLDLIVEGPSKWTVRPVLELYSDSVLGGPQTFSALIGAIWQVRDDLAFDVGLRYAVVDGRPVDELRAGVTFAFPLNLGRPAGEGVTNPAATGRRLSPAAAYAGGLEY
jgi:hypothetical protein